MASQIQLADDLQFWSRQMTEHALFLRLLFADPALASEAGRLHEDWYAASAFAAPPDLLPLLDRLIDFKERVLARQARGDWVGWAWPSFVQHILFEARYFRARLLPRGTTADEDYRTWLRVVQDHAAVGPKLVDPMAEPYADRARDAASQLGDLQRRCGGRPDKRCALAVDEAISGVTAWVRGVPAGLNVVLPALGAHILREQERAMLVTRAAAGVA